MAGLRVALLFVAILSIGSAYNPDTQNIYHLFTRSNPSLSQPMILGNNAALQNSNFVAQRRTAVLIHGFLGSATADINTVCVPAYLAAADMNVFVVDWSAGSGLLDGVASENAIPSGQSVARFINWVINLTGTNINNFHLVGHSLGAHQAAVVGRDTNGRIPYITALDPGAGMANTGHIFSPNVGIYTEAIHTNADVMGHGSPLAHVDFYPNGGDLMPGCGINFVCSHNRAIFYFGESILGGNFIGRSCATLAQARLGLCFGTNTLRMGGLTPKRATGIFHLTTNAQSPFAQG